MRILPLLTISLALIMSLSSTVSADQSAAQWSLVPHSHDNDFQIYCYEGGKLIYGIYNRNNTSDYQVARDVYVRTLPDGRTQLSFLRGFTSADKETTYLPGVNVSCDVSER